MRLTLVLLLIVASGCAETHTRLGPSRDYDTSRDVTRYTTPWIQLMQRADVSTQHVRFVVMAACEGYHRRCSPNETVWQFETGQQVAQFLGDQELGLHIDGRLHSFKSGAYRGQFVDLERSPSPQFRIPLDIVREVAMAENVSILLGGNSMQFSDRRREVLRHFLAAVQGD